MAISVRKLIYRLNRKLGALSTSQSRQYRVVDLVDLLNEAAEVIVDKNVKLTEKDSRYKANIRQLEVKNQELNIKDVTSKISFAKYPKDLLKRLNQVTISSCPGCNSKEIIPRIVSSDDLQQARQDPYRKADFPYNQLIADEAGEGLYIYHDGVMKIEKIFIDYYRKIKEVQAPSLVECNDNQYLDYDENLIIKDVDFELSSTYASRRLVDVAELLGSVDSNDFKGFEARLNNIIALENLDF